MSTARELGAALLVLLLGVFVFALTGCGPIGPLAGGKLRGVVHSAPVDDWSFSDSHQTVQIETNPAAPHSVNTWCLGLGPRLYVPTSMIRGPKVPSEREWVKNVAEDPRLRIRIGDEIYERVAVRVRDPAEYELARAGLEKKYALDPANRDPEREIWIFRLEPRGT